MKRFISVLAAAAVLVACSKDPAPSVSFTQQTYALTNGSIEVSVSTSDFKTSTSASIPVTFSGSAVKGEDYTVSSEAFNVGGASESLKITVSAKDNYDADKVITMTLGAADGISLGKYSIATITLSKKDMRLYSFVKKQEALTATANVEFKLSTSTGGTFSAEEVIEIPVVVDNEKSTAVEGTNFEFAGDKKVTVKVGGDTGTISLNCKTVDPDHNVLYLKPDFTNMKGFVAGQYPEVKVVILGSYADQILGTWKMSSFVTDKTEMDSAWGGAEDLTNFPDVSADDQITIGADFQTKFSKGFERYFSEQSDMSIGDEFTMRVGMGTKITVQILILNHINRYFSATTKSDDDVAYVGVRLTDEGLLDVYVFDYEPKDFFADFADYGMFNETKPVLTMSGCYLNFLMSKAE